MNDEIKEKIKAYYIGDDIEKVLDYITNLQKENEAKEKVIKKQDYVINELEKWLINETEKLHNISGDNFTTVGQKVYQEVLDKLKELKEEK